MNTVWLIAIGFLTLIGIIEVIEMIKRWVMRGKNQGHFLICVPVGGEEPALEYKIRSLVQRMNESDFAAGEPVYLVDVGWMATPWKSAGAWENNTSKSMFVTAGSSKL